MALITVYPISNYYEDSYTQKMNMPFKIVRVNPGIEVPYEIIDLAIYSTYFKNMGPG